LRIDALRYSCGIRNPSGSSELGDRAHEIDHAIDRIACTTPRVRRIASACACTVAQKFEPTSDAHDADPAADPTADPAVPNST
jgi:hypothetical protein